MRPENRAGCRFSRQLVWRGGEGSCGAGLASGSLWGPLGASGSLWDCGLPEVAQILLGRSILSEHPSAKDMPPPPFPLPPELVGGSCQPRTGRNGGVSL